MEEGKNNLETYREKMQVDFVRHVYHIFLTKSEIFFFLTVLEEKAKLNSAKVPYMKKKKKKHKKLCP